MSKHHRVLSQAERHRRAILKAQSMIEAIKANADIQGHDWARGMLRHWERRLAELQGVKSR